MRLFDFSCWCAHTICSWCPDWGCCVNAILFSTLESFLDIWDFFHVLQPFFGRKEEPLNEVKSTKFHIQNIHTKSSRILKKSPYPNLKGYVCYYCPLWKDFVSCVKSFISFHDSSEWPLPRRKKCLEERIDWFPKRIETGFSELSRKNTFLYDDSWQGHAERSSGHPRLSISDVNLDCQLTLFKEGNYWYLINPNLGRSKLLYNWQ